MITESNIMQQPQKNRYALNTLSAAIDYVLNVLSDLQTPTLAVPEPPIPIVYGIRGFGQT